MTRKLLSLFCLVLLSVALHRPVLGAGNVGTAVTFSCSDGEATVAAKGGASVSSGGQTIYIGYRQLGNNKDPIAASFTGGLQDWCHTDYESTPDDNEGYGLFWDGTASGLYGVFSATGTQGSSSEDFRRFATNGWLSSYTDGSPGGGGGPKAAIVARLDPATGLAQEATFITAVLSSGKTNSMQVTDLALENGLLHVQANSWYSPRNLDKSGMSCSGSSPFAYTLYLTADLTTAVSAAADNCVGNGPILPEMVTLSPEIGFVGEMVYTAVLTPSNATGPFTYTWTLNGSQVRQVTVSSATDTLPVSWPAPAANQTLSVTVDSAALQAASLPPISSGVSQFDVVEARRLFLPAVQSP